VYFAVALGMNAWFCWTAATLLRERTDAAARRMFRVSLAFLFSIFFAMFVDLVV